MEHRFRSKDGVSDQSHDHHLLKTFVNDEFGKKQEVLAMLKLDLIQNIMHLLMALQLLLGPGLTPKTPPFFFVF
jgi:hypothetical protein